MSNYEKNKTEVINMRLTKDKKDALKQITKKLRVTRTELLEQHIDHLLALYQ